MNNQTTRTTEHGATIELIEPYSSNPMRDMGFAAAECYDSDRSDSACMRRARQCHDRGHLAVMRFAVATFRISGISRACSHQFVRVAHAGILQRSQRYVRESRIEYVDPPSLRAMPPHLRTAWLRLQSETEAIYLQAVDNGMPKGDARYLLPQGCATSLVITGNYQMWRDLLANRTDKAAQWEIRAVALQIRSILAELAPGLGWGD